MLRSSLSVLSLLVLSACGSADIGERAQQAELVGSDESALRGCTTYDGYTATLGALTVDCLGTVGPDLYKVDDRGRLRRTFDRCQKGAEGLIKDIDNVLGLQLMEKEQPGLAQCMAGGWEGWLKGIQQIGPLVCPVWKKIKVVNPPTPRVTDAIARNLPKLPSKDEATTAGPQPKEDYVYSVQFPVQIQKDQRCTTPAACAELCVGGFAGAWIKGEGETAMLDPLYWLVTTDYAGTTNPFMRAGYYHKMSYYGDDPGMIYGHYNRTGEYCSRFYDGAHYLMQLELECLSDGDLSTCASRCGTL